MSSGRLCRRWIIAKLILSSVFLVVGATLAPISSRVATTTFSTTEGMTMSSSTAATKITSPTLLLDKKRCLRNLERMQNKAQQANVRLRPHCKTHASLEVARMYNPQAVTSITVSSLSMAEYFASEWEDITVAFPVNLLEIELIYQLAKKIQQLNVLVENVEAVEFLEQKLKSMEEEEDDNENSKSIVIGVFIKIDVGYGRTGIPIHDDNEEDYARLESVLKALDGCTKLRFLGFLTHAGHSYHCRSKEDVQSLYQTTTKLFTQLRHRYKERYPDLQLSYGDTPTCSVVSATDLTQEEGDGKPLFDEIRPGNFVFYDLEQAEIGSCTWDDIAVAVACPIVAKHENRRELVVYGGGVHFSKDRLYDKTLDKTIFGRVVRSNTNAADDDNGWGDVIPKMYVRSLSQEHGIIVVPESEDMSLYQVGDVVKILPVHSCMTADCLKHKGYRLVGGGDAGAETMIERMKN